MVVSLVQKLSGKLQKELKNFDLIIGKGMAKVLKIGFSLFLQPMVIMMREELLISSGVLFM